MRPGRATPRSILRAVRKMEGHDKGEIMRWMRAIAPEALVVLYQGLQSENQEVKQRAALAILQWTLGKPPTIDDRSLAGAGKIYEIVAPSEAPSFEHWVAGANGKGNGNGMAGAAGAAGSAPLVPRP